MSEELLRARKFYQDFFTGEGKLPMGFSDTFFKGERQADGTMRWEQRTPFDDYLDMLIKELDGLTNRSGISDWITFVGSEDIHRSALEIISWKELVLKTNTVMEQKVPSEYFWVSEGMPKRCKEKLMIVINSEDVLRGITENEIKLLTESNISVCRILSDKSYYDVFQGKKYSIMCLTYSGSADDAATYGEWFFWS